MKKDRQSTGIMEISDYGKRRLLTYADSFRELAMSLNGEFCFASDDREKLLEARSRWESRQVLGENLQEVAHIMTRAALEAFHCRPVEERKRKLILHTLKAEGIQATELFYIEKNNERTGIGLTMHVQRGTDRKAGEVADMLSVALNRRLVMSAASPYLVVREDHNFVLMEEAPYIIMTGVAKAVKENETSSGDNYAFIESERGKFTVLLSDGTGSGEKAGEDSGKILDMMEKMIEADFDMECAVNLVNSAVLARGEEQSLSTLDVCDLDLYKGTCEFHKAGAAASFVKREHLVEQIDSHCLPLGVFQNIGSEVISCELMDGDYIIMMTDGVLDALETKNYEETMKRRIADMKERNPNEMAQCLLKFALRCSGGHIADDMTVVVAGIWENSALKGTTQRG